MERDTNKVYLEDIRAQENQELIQKNKELILRVAPKCHKDRNGWSLVSDFRALAGIEFGYGGASGFLKNYLDIVEVENFCKPNGGSNWLFRLKPMSIENKDGTSNVFCENEGNVSGVFCFADIRGFTKWARANQTEISSLVEIVYKMRLLLSVVQVIPRLKNKKNRCS